MCPTAAPIEFFIADVITNNLFSLWYERHAPQSSFANAQCVYVFPSVLANKALDFTKPLDYNEHKNACRMCVDVLGLTVSQSFHDNLGANTVRRGNAATIGQEIRGPSCM